MRIKIIRLIIYVLFVIICLDLIYIQAIRGQYFYNLSKNNRIRVVPVEGARGTIYDRNQVVLAEDLHSYNVFVTPQEVRDTQSLFRFLGEVLNVDESKLIQKYMSANSAPFAPVAIAEDVLREEAIVLEENRYRFPSLYVQEGFKRNYPLGKVSAHVLGYVGKVNRSTIERFKEYGFSPQSIIGYLGVEEYYDAYLKGVPGGSQVEVDSRGKQVRLLSVKEPQKGGDITLTIDHRVQEISSNLLQGKVGAITVMDMDNGEILGLISSPSFDPNIFMDQSQISKRKTTALLANTKSPFLNRAIKGLFPPGSVFKIPVALCGLGSKKITQHTSFLCKGFYELAGLKFGCAHVHGQQNLIEAIIHSCNVYFYQLGKIIGADQIHNYAKMLGLGQLTHIDLPYEKQGNIPSRKQGLLSKKRRWYTGDTLNLSIGQGDVLITPLQLTRMMATVAKGGLQTQPHIIKNIGQQRIDKFDLKDKVKIEPRFFQLIQKGLRASVTDYSGTAHVLNMEDVYVAGKTGTAQTSKDQESHAWFAGYTKGTNKDVAFCIFLEHGGSSRNACLLARELLLRMKKQNIL